MTLNRFRSQNHVALLWPNTDIELGTHLEFKHIHLQCPEEKISKFALKVRQDARKRNYRRFAFAIAINRCYAFALRATYTQRLSPSFFPNAVRYLLHRAKYNDD